MQPVSESVNGVRPAVAPAADSAVVATVGSTTVVTAAETVQVPVDLNVMPEMGLPSVIGLEPP